MALFTWLHAITGTQTSPRQPGRSATNGRSQPQHSALPNLTPGDTLSADFSHHHETVHAICRVQQQIERRLRLRVLSEVGKVPLLGLKEGTLGTLETKTKLFPFRVTHTALPVVEVVIFVDQARPAERQLLRIPSSFAARIRQLRSGGSWISGRGIDLSAGGCCFAFTASHIPTPGTLYELEMTVPFHRDDQEQLSVIAEVRWGKRIDGEIHVGVEVRDPTERRELTMIVSKLQQSMSRHPKDYLLT